MWETPDTRYARRDRLHLAYQVVGDAPPRIVFLPEWLTHLEAQWDHPPAARFLRRLGAMGGVLLLNRRGTGLSEPASEADLASVDHWLEDLEIVLDEVGAGRVAVVCCAGGTPVGALFAATHPERVDRLVLINGFARLSAAPDHPIGIDPSRHAQILDDVEENWGSGDTTMSWVAPSVAGNEDAERWLARYERLSASPATAAAILRMALSLDVRSVLGSIHAPTLVIHRRDNAFTPLAQGVSLAEGISGARLVELPGRDTLYWAGDTAVVLAEIEAFLEAPGTGAPVDDRVYVTMMFTDIVGSTELAASMGDGRWTELLECHDQTLRSCARAFGGAVLDTVGDGALTVFDGSNRAVACAVRLREDLAPLGLRVRTGLHAAEVQRRGNQIAGLNVHVGARIAALGGAGDIYASSTVVDLAVGAGHVFQAIGQQDLKGVPGRWPVFSLT